MNLFIYVTSDTTSDKRSDSSSLASTGAIDDAEKGREGVTDQAIGLPSIRYGRPDVFNLVTYFISQCGSESRVGVGACGPTQMIRMTQNAVSQEANDIGPSITFHTEVSDHAQYSKILT